MAEAGTVTKPSSKSSLTPEAAELLRSIQATGFPGWAALGVEQGRAAILQMEEFAGPAQPVARFEKVRLTNTDAFLYIPESSRPAPILVYMHGGGWVLGRAASVDSLVRTRVHISGCAVLSVDYRLAPEHKYPAALDDVLSGLEWVAANAQKFGIDARRMTVGGDSSGANLAAAAALSCRDNSGPALMFQILVYPALDHDYQTESYIAFGDGRESALSRTDVAWFQQQYVTRPDELDLPLVSPLRAQSLERLPQTLLICGEVDPLLDENKTYAQRLKEAGVPVELIIQHGMFHGFWRMGGVLADAQRAIQYAAQRMRTVMRSET